MSIEIMKREHKEVGFGDEMLKYFVDARFTSSKRDWIEVLTNENKESLTSTHVEFDEKHPYFISLMKVTNIEKIHESTYRHNEEQKKEFEQVALAIAKREGLVQTDDTSPNRVLDFIFNPEEATEDEMFALKIALFEIDKIRDSKNLDGKKALRKCKTRIELLKGALNLYCEVK
jgi:UDP-N-acetylmuramate-alanine ligase